LGFVGAFAVELTVGATFLNALVPALPAAAGLLALGCIGVGYTVLGGFRAVILTDRIQMRAIWLSIVALSIAILLVMAAGGGVEATLAKAPSTLYDFSPREGLVAFLIGIFIINVPTFLADMSVWQRIAGSRDEATVKTGLAGSVVGAVVSWSSFALIACALVVVVTAVPNENPLVTFLRTLGDANLLTSALFLVVITGLYAASLSTASTQLVAAGQALHMDVLRGRGDRPTLGRSSSELVTARRLLFAIASFSIVLVWGLQTAGFTIADLVFAVYGAQLGMVPAVIAALFAPQHVLRRLGRWASAAVLVGFATGWATAGYGKWIGDGNIVFLAPATSLAVSTMILAVGSVMRGARVTAGARM
jgi:sodium/proline symporter